MFEDARERKRHTHSTQYTVQTHRVNIRMMICLFYSVLCVCLEISDKIYVYITQLALNNVNRYINKNIQ